MKKLLTVLTLITLLLSVPSFIRAEENKLAKGPDKPAMRAHARPLPREGLKKAIGIKRKMREIERETIKNDPELQELWKEIKELHKQMRAKLDEKLAENEEYQKLKEQLEKMRQEWKERWQKRKKEKKEGQGKGKKRNQ